MLFYCLSMYWYFVSEFLLSYLKGQCQRMLNGFFDRITHRVTFEKFERKKILGKVVTQIENILTRFSTTQTGSFDGNNQRLEISWHCPFNGRANGICSSLLTSCQPISTHGHLIYHHPEDSKSSSAFNL